MATNGRSLAAGYVGADVLNEWIAPLICEFIGPLALTFAGAGAIIMTQGKDLVAIALAHGLAIGLFVAAAGHISGGAYNPAITIGLLIGKRISPLKTVGYVIVQLLGATVAALLLKGVFPSSMWSQVSLGVPAVGSGFGIGGALLAEIVTTFFLMFVIYGVAIDKRGPGLIAGLCIGLTITIDIFCVGAVSGAAMNPSRHFGVALVGGYWANWWIWYVGPVIGAALAALVYNYILIPQEKGSPAA